MNREKQIEEMAWDLCDIPKHPSIHSCKECGGKHCHARYHAERAYNAGYRKQSEGEWIVTDADSGSFGEYEPFIEFKCPECGVVHGLESGEYDWQYGDPIPWVSCPCCGAKMKDGANNDEKRVV